MSIEIGEKGCFYSRVIKMPFAAKKLDGAYENSPGLQN
jgi:hypothetical protein